MYLLAVVSAATQASTKQPTRAIEFATSTVDLSDESVADIPIITKYQATQKNIKRNLWPGLIQIASRMKEIEHEINHDIMKTEIKE